MRNRIVAYTLAFCLAAVFSRPPRQVAAVQPQEAGYLERIGGICVSHVRGGPYEMGLQQGALLRSELRTLIRDYVYGRLIVKSDSSHFWLLYQGRLLDQAIPASLRQEMHGIADGAGISYQDVLLLNTAPDLQALTGKMSSWDLLPGLFSTANQRVLASPSFLCAAFAGWGRATANGELLVGHNPDCAGGDPLQSSLTLTVRQPSTGDSFVALGLPGAVGVWTGMNEEQITVALSGAPSADVALAGQPLPLLLRQVLESSGSLTEAVGLLLSTKRLSGGNVILGDGKAPQAAVLELSAHQHALFQGDATGDLLLRTNLFLDPELATTQGPVLSAEERAAGETRLRGLQHVFESNRGWIGPDKTLALLGSVNEAASGGAELVGTLQTILLNPARLTLWVGQRDSDAVTATSYVRLDLASELLAGR